MPVTSAIPTCSTVSATSPPWSLSREILTVLPGPKLFRQPPPSMRRHRRNCTFCTISVSSTSTRHRRLSVRHQRTLTPARRYRTRQCYLHQPGQRRSTPPSVCPSRLRAWTSVNLPDGPPYRPACPSFRYARLALEKEPNSSSSSIHSEKVNLVHEKNRPAFHLARFPRNPRLRTAARRRLAHQSTAQPARPHLPRPR